MSMDFLFEDIGLDQVVLICWVYVVCTLYYHQYRLAQRVVNLGRHREMLIISTPWETEAAQCLSIESLPFGFQVTVCDYSPCVLPP